MPRVGLKAQAAAGRQLPSDRVFGPLDVLLVPLNIETRDVRINFVENTTD